MLSPERDLWYGTSGPHDAPLVIVGEAWGAEEAAQQRPFVGSSGTELNRMLAEASLDRSQILLTNVVADRPLGNEIWRLFAPIAAPSGEPLIRGLDPSAFVRRELERLHAQLASVPRKCILAFGNYALWALTNCCGTTTLRESNGRTIEPTKAPTGILNWRGSMWYADATSVPRTPLVPLVHPAAIMRQWTLRAPTVHDLKLRVRDLAMNGNWRPQHAPVFLAPPTFAQARNRLQMWLSQAGPNRELWLAEDIETSCRLITCIGLADSTNFAMAIPFIRLREDKSFESFWPLDQEVELLALLRRIQVHPWIRIIGQNFLYDSQYIEHWFAVQPRCAFDTMLCQNVLFPGTPKALEYLASLYCRYYWFWKEDSKEWNTRTTGLEDLLRYNCMDCVRTWEVASVQRTMVEHLRQTDQMALKMRIHDLCLRMMRRGIAVDLARRSELSLELMHSMQELESELGTIIPQSMVSPDNKTPWFRSDQQTRYLFYDRLGFEIQRDRKTGKPTIGKEARYLLARKYPEFSGLFKRLALYGSAENTYKVINAGLDSDNHIRSSLNPGATETHRLASSKTAFGLGMNLQNLTKGHEEDDND